MGDLRPNDDARQDSPTSWAAPCCKKGHDVKALIYDGVETLGYRDVADPTPGEGEALVRVDAVGICGSDMHAYLGHDARRPAPLILGHEAAGVIAGGARDGERVTINPLVHCGTCRACLAGRENLCPNRQIISMQPREGAFAQFVTIPEANLVVVPDHVHLDHAALAEPLAVSWHAVRLGLAALHPGAEQRALVIGGGAIGLAAALAFQAQGMNNVTISNYIRDKGFGMGGVVGYIPSAVGGKKVNISPVGTVFPTTTENMGKWRAWWKYVLCDQVALWAVGCFVGMFLNCILAAHIIPPGTELTGLAAGAYQASYLEAEGGKLLGFVTLLNGFWILFGSQLVVVDALTRVNTDIVWSMSNRLREIAGGDIRKVYYSLLVIYAVWGSIAINLAPPRALILIASNAAGFILLFSAINVLVLNKMMLPKAVQGSLWLRALVVCAALFYGFFFFMNLRQLFF